MCVPLVWRRRFTVPVLALTYLVGLGQLVFGVPVRPYDLAIVIMMYTVAAYGPRWAARTAVVAGLLGSVLAMLRWGRAPSTADFFLGLGVVTAPVLIAWAVGDNLQTRRAYLAQLEDRATRLERERDARARAAVAEDRARIARELHDVVAHGVSVIVVQSDGAAAALHDGDLPEVDTALQAIGRTGRSALTELRLLLGLLRQAEGDGSYSPQPAAEQIADLLGQVPLPVNLVVQGARRDLPSGMGLVAYRIVQEALTNTLKHAGPDTSAVVRLCYRADVLEVDVEDDGRGPLPEGPQLDGGHGLVGMRERAAMFGGTLRVSGRPGGGFRVRARLPWESA